MTFHLYKLTESAGFEPTRAKPNGFQVHHLNHLGQLSFSEFLHNI